MVAPNDTPMTPKHLLLRVHSIREIRGSALPEPQEPRVQEWEVRADWGTSDSQASIFYREHNPRELPPLDSLIHITIDDCIVDPSDNPEPPTEE